MSRVGRVLVVDDEPYVRDSLCSVLADEGWSVHSAGSAPEALEVLAREPVDVVVSDLRMPGGDVFDLLERLQPDAIPVPVVVITGVGTVPEAVRAMKAGAFDFLQKPIDPDELLLLASRAAEHHRLRGEVEELREAVGRLRAPRALVGGSRVMVELRARLADLALVDGPVLIRGESGTGKELAAEELHARGPRASSPLRRLRCPRVGGEELEGALRGRGTVLLDEVGRLASGAQTDLARILDACAEGGGARVLATTNADLERAVRAGSFRSDLFFRLHVLAVDMPPLREHREDVPEIVEHLLSWARATGGGAGEGAAATPEALEVLASYAWPGNVRELRNVLERAVLVAGDRPLDAALLRSVLEPATGAPAPADDGRDESELRLRPNLDAAEKDLVVRALASAQGVKKRAAFLLGIDPRNLGYYLRKHGL